MNSLTANTTAPPGAGQFRHILEGLQCNRQDLDSGGLRQAALLAFGRRANAQPPLGVLVQDALTLLAEVLRADLVGVADVVDGGTAVLLKVLRMGRSAGRAEPLLHKACMEPTASLAAYALTTASPVLSPDLGADTRFADAFLRRLKVASAVTIPIHVLGKPFGALAAYHTAPGGFTQEEAQFAESIAHLLATSIGQAKLQQELASQRALQTAIFNTVPALVLVLDNEGHVLEMNAPCREASGFMPSELRNRPFWQALVAPEEAEATRRAFLKAENHQPGASFEAILLSKDGTRRHVSWTLRAVAPEHQAQARYVLAGIDRARWAVIHQAPSPSRQCAAPAGSTAPPATAPAVAPLSLPVPESPNREHPESDTAVSGPSFGPRADPLPAGRERRTSPRKAYHYRQRIAPMVGGLLPPKRKFFEVQCRDISAGGFSFLLDRKPDFETLVVCLGRPPAETFFTARVVRCVEVQENGETWLLVGCRFTGRVQL